MGTPTLAGFQLFITTVMDINATVLPPTTPVIQVAYDVALEVVNVALAATGIYDLAVYNLAGDNLLNYAPDQPGQTYFKEVRKSLNLAGFVPGVVSSSSDEGSSTSLLNPEFMKGLTMSDLQNLKTPYGRTYLGFAQRYGTLWGMS